MNRETILGSYYSSFKEPSHGTRKLGTIKMAKQGNVEEVSGYVHQYRIDQQILITSLK